MIQICRLNIPEKDGMSMREVVEGGCRLARIEYNDLVVGCFGTKTHFGNWCLTPVCDGEPAARLAAVFGPLINPATGADERIDLRRYLLMPADIEHLQVGDKVILKQSPFARREDGEVVHKGEHRSGQPYVDVMRFPATDRDYRFEAGDEIGIFVIGE